MARSVSDHGAFSRVAYRSRRLSAPLRWLRHRGLAPADRFVASYPRSGSTWLRFMLFEAMADSASTFRDVNRAIPDVGRHRAGTIGLPGGGRLIKTHEPYRSAYAGGIYVVRDPRSVVVSEFRWARATGLYRRSLDRFVEDFVAGRVHRFGSWAGNVRSWLDGAAARDGALLVLRFEDLRADPVDAVRSACAFLGMPASTGRLRRAVEHTTLEHMRRKERAAGDELRLHGETGRRFIDRGSTGGWIEVLRPAQVVAIEAHAGPILDRLGYSARATA